MQEIPFESMLDFYILNNPPKEFFVNGKKILITFDDGPIIIDCENGGFELIILACNRSGAKQISSQS